MPRRWRCVAFDLDGTLANSLPALRQAYAEFLGELNRCGSDAEFVRLNGPSMTTIVFLLKEWHGLSDPHEELLRRYYGHVRRAYAGVQPAQGADELLRFAAVEGYDRALVTSSPRSTVRGVLDRLNWKGCFDVTVCGDEVPVAKPDPAVYQRACALGGWQPDECVAVEDASSGIRAAVAAGLDVIGVGPPERLAELRDRGAAWTCTTLMRVRETLKELSISAGSGYAQGHMTPPGLRPPALHAERQE